MRHPVYFPRTDRLGSLKAFKENVNRYGFASRFTRGGVVLDCACGSGYGSHILLQLGASRVVSGDMQETALSSASRLYKQPGLEFAQLEACQLPFGDESFDLVVSFQTIQHLKQPDKFLQECARCLKEGGVFVISGPVKNLDEIARRHFADVQLYGHNQLWTRRGAFLAKCMALIGKVILRLPGIEKIINLVTRFIFREYQAVRLSEVGALNMLDERYEPVPLPLGKRGPIAMVVARKQKGGRNR